jgi:hypothetical protein
MVQQVSRKISDWEPAPSVPEDTLIPVTVNGVTYRATKQQLTATSTVGMSALSAGAVNKTILQAAYDALNALGGGTLEIGAGTFALSGNVRMYSNIHTRMSPGTVLDISAAGSVTCLVADGTEGTAMALTANALKGATSITLSAPNAATLSQGKWVRVASDSVFNASDTNSKIGELAQVKSVAGTTVNLEGPLRGGPYNTANNATASLVTPVENIRVSGGRIKGGGTLTTVGSDADCNGIRIFLGSNCSVEDVRFERCDLSGVWFQDSTFCHVTRCHFQDAVNDNQAYGVLWDNACQDCTMHDCTGDRIRHLVTTGNSTTTKGITRRIKFSCLTVYSTTTARGGTGGDAIDTHGAAEDIQISNCTVYSSTGGGINVECASATIEGCQIFDTTDYGIIFHNESDQEGEVVISGNRVVNAGLGGTWEGIRVNMPTRGSTAINRSIVVSGNLVTDCTGIGIYVVNSTGSGKSKGVTVTGNTVSGAGSSSASIYIEDVNGGVVTGNTVTDPVVINQQAILLRDCFNLAVTGNTVRHKDSSTGIGIYVNASSAASSAYITIAGNSVSSITPSNLRGAYLDDNANNCVVDANNFQSCNQEVRRGTGAGHDIPGDTFGSVTIASGVVTINRNWTEVVVDTEGGAGTDDLDTINGAVAGQTVTFRSANSSRVPTLTHNVGNILCGAGGQSLPTTNAAIIATFCNGNKWRFVARATNP